MMTTTIPILPDIPKAKYDELLGSWFSRVASANQAATWKYLLRQCGYKLNGQPPVDIGGPTERYKLLCSALGRSYAKLTLEMTTLSFWLFFEASPTEYMYEGEVNIPARSIAGRRNSGTVKLRGNLGHLKYCPSCLKEQIAIGSGMYWRRSHQLPVSFVCQEHKDLLRSACFSCGRIPELHLQRILKMPRQQCVCGADLTAPPASNPKCIEQLNSLSQFSFKALNAGLPTWTRSHVLAVALAIISDEWRGKLTVAFDAMEACFGLDRYSRYGLRFANTTMHPGGSYVILQGNPLNWTALTFAAFFVASGVEFADLRDRLGDSSSISRGFKPSSSAMRRLGASVASTKEAGDVPAAKDATTDRFQKSWKRAKPMMHVDSSPIPTASESRARKLHGALQQVLSNQQWPSRVRVFELALAFGTSEPKLRRLIAVEPAFKEEIARINNDYRAERIRWKFSLLASEQRSLYITVFLKEISLMGTSSNINTVLKVADEQPNWPVLVHGRRNPF